MLTEEEALAIMSGRREEMPSSPRSAEEILEAMQVATSNFYRDAIGTNCHTYIEFTGLIREYIKICEENLKQGIDQRKDRTCEHNCYRYAQKDS